MSQGLLASERWFCADAVITDGIIVAGSSHRHNHAERMWPNSDQPDTTANAASETCFVPHIIPRKLILYRESWSEWQDLRLSL